MFARSSPSFLFTDNFSLSGFFYFSAVESVYSLFCCYSSTTVSPTIIRAMNLIYRFGYFLSLSRTLRSVCVPRTCHVVTRGPVNALRRSRIFIPALCDFLFVVGICLRLRMVHTCNLFSLFLSGRRSTRSGTVPETSWATLTNTQRSSQEGKLQRFYEFLSATESGKHGAATPTSQPSCSKEGRIRRQL